MCSQKESSGVKVEKDDMKPDEDDMKRRQSEKETTNESTGSNAELTAWTAWTAFTADSFTASTRQSTQHSGFSVGGLSFTLHAVRCVQEVLVAH